MQNACTNVMQVKSGEFKLVWLVIIITMMHFKLDYHEVQEKAKQQCKLVVQYFGGLLSAYIFDVQNQFSFLLLESQICKSLAGLLTLINHFRDEAQFSLCSNALKCRKGHPKFPFKIMIVPNWSGCVLTSAAAFLHRIELRDG